MSNTPESDDHDQEHAISGYTLDFCRKLERERDEARNAFIMAVDEMVKAQSQLREAKIEWDEAREQRDRLASLVQKCEVWISHQPTGFTMQRKCNEALQSLTQTK